jgi:hypothetical protein
VVDNLVRLALIVVLIAGIGAWVGILINFIKTFQHIKEGKKPFLYLDPTAFFRSAYFTEEGEVYRVKMLKNMLLFFALCFLMVLIILSKNDT